jgi:DNA-directed RNA polymerase subunit RPC12/RpoP
MMKFKGCPHCGGDVTAEEMHGETELVCLQCGRRTYTVYRLHMPRRIQRGRPGVHRQHAA